MGPGVRIAPRLIDSWICMRAAVLGSLTVLERVLTHAGTENISHGKYSIRAAEKPTPRI